MKLKGYFALFRAGILDQLQWRGSMYITFIGNLVYLVIIYFLWKAIYASSPNSVVNGMNFQDTMIYLVLATAMFNFMEMFVVWHIGRSVSTGGIVLELLKPISYDKFILFSIGGATAITFFTTLLPTGIIVYLLTDGGFQLSTNLIYFAISIALGVIINYYINFSVGIICFYTESIWGINIMKDIIVLLLSGATIPLAFFPEALQAIVYKLPFQAVYNTPLKILIDSSISNKEVFTLILVQVFWVGVLYILSKIFFNISVKKITVNGG